MTSQRNIPSSKMLSNKFGALRFQRGLVFTFIILAALLAFEAFNYSTTQFALGALLGNLTFVGVSWATILSIAFCGIDFAGIARLFTPERGSINNTEAWYLFGAWMLAATMNAILTWWAVSLAIENHPLESTAVIDQSLLVKIVPIFVAIMVWLIRILIIGSLSMAGDRLFGKAGQPAAIHNPESGRSFIPQPEDTPTFSTRQPAPAVNLPATSFQPMHRAAIRQDRPIMPQPAPEQTNETANLRPEPDRTPMDRRPTRPEPTYQPISASARPNSPSRLM